MADRSTALALVMAAVWPTPPFDAWVRSGKVYLRAAPEVSRQVGMVRRGDVVGIMLSSGIDYAVAYHAIIRAGAVATGINPRLGPAEVHHIHRAAGPVHVFDGPLPQL